MTDRSSDPAALDVGIVGTGFIGGIIGRALAGAGHRVVFGSRHPDQDEIAEVLGASVTPIGEALAAPVVILALPGTAVSELTAEFGDRLAGKLVVDATNRSDGPVAHSRSALPESVRYARAFNTMGGENMADPVFAEGRADLFFSAAEEDRETVERIIEAVGPRPVYVGTDREDLVDGLFRLWIALAIEQGRGRRLAFRLLEE